MVVARMATRAGSEVSRLMKKLLGFSNINIAVASSSRSVEMFRRFRVHLVMETKTSKAEGA